MSRPVPVPGEIAALAEVPQQIGRALAEIGRLEAAYSEAPGAEAVIATDGLRQAGHDLRKLRHTPEIMAKSYAAGYAQGFDDGYAQGRAAALAEIEAARGRLRRVV